MYVDTVSRHRQMLPLPDNIGNIYHYRPIDDLLATSGQPSEAQLAAIAQAGFEVVINLAYHDDPRYSLPDEPGRVRELGMIYVHIPVPFDAPTENELRRFIEIMTQLRTRKCWIHCAANKRVTAFLGLYRVLDLGWTPAAAFAPMRTVWEPDAVWSAFIAAMQARQQR